MSLQIFVSYAKEDRDRALQYYDLLQKEGAVPWLDAKDILPGQNWEVEIEKAFSEANVIVLLLSRSSVNKRGFVQREVNDAIERLRYKQPTDIYVIPLLLEQCDVPNHIANRLQYIDLTVVGAWDQVRASLRLAAEQQSIELAEGVIAGPFKFFTQSFKDQWLGAPGHDISIDYPRFQSTINPKAAEELSLFFAGRAAQTLVKSRQKPWDQTPELFPEIERFRAMSGRWDSFGIVHATNQVLSLSYEVGWYGAGAAHPNSHFETYNFSLSGHLLELELSDFFWQESVALKRISEMCIAQLCREYWSRVGEKPDEAQLKWFQSGAGESNGNFSSFTLSADHFTFLFPPYQVGPYALGRWSADISFYDLLDQLRPHGPHTLAVELR